VKELCGYAIRAVDGEIGQVDGFLFDEEFDPAVPVNRAYELRLYDYYGRPKYWAQVDR
jgi:hypothetical protein